MKFKLFLIAYFLLLAIGAIWLARRDAARQQAPLLDNKVTQIY